MTSPQCERQPGAAAQVRAPASIGSAGVPVPPPSQSPACRLPVFSPGAVLRMLWQHARRSLTPQELWWLAEGVPEFSSMYCGELAAVLESLACMVAADGDESRSGCFQNSKDLPDLLFVQANQMNVLSGLLYVAGDATTMLREGAAAH